MKHVRRSIVLVVVTATMLLVSASVAIAQEYPPEPGPTPGNAAVSAGGGGNLASTGSDMTLFWVALVVLVTGSVLALATRRRAVTRRRMALGEVGN
jgi:hypothetical protein